ncbi:hypothetical protein LEN26_015326 [Aphanomyces euteiches]|nr:hypothetical protein LEN26_015326 [Aphanomyces euteiches]
MPGQEDLMEDETKDERAEKGVDASSEHENVDFNDEGHAREEPTDERSTPISQNTTTSTPTMHDTVYKGSEVTAEDASAEASGVETSKNDDTVNDINDHQEETPPEPQATTLSSTVTLSKRPEDDMEEGEVEEDIPYVKPQNQPNDQGDPYTQADSYEGDANTVGCAQPNEETKEDIPLTPLEEYQKGYHGIQFSQTSTQLPKVIVRDPSNAVTENDLRAYFIAFGTIEACTWSPEAGVGEFTFPSLEVLNKLFSLPEHTVSGSTLIVSPMPPPVDQTVVRQWRESYGGKGVHLGNVLHEMTEDVIKSEMSCFGVVTNIRLFLKPKEEAPFGYGFVVYAKSSQAAHALAAGYHSILGAQVKISQMKEGQRFQRNNSFGGRGSTRGRGHDARGGGWGRGGRGMSRDGGRGGRGADFHGGRGRGRGDFQGCRGGRGDFEGGRGGRGDFQGGRGGRGDFQGGRGGRGGRFQGGRGGRGGDFHSGRGGRGGDFQNNWGGHSNYQGGRGSGPRYPQQPSYQAPYQMPPHQPPMYHGGPPHQGPPPYHVYGLPAGYPTSTPPSYPPQQQSAYQQPAYGQHGGGFPPQGYQQPPAYPPQPYQPPPPYQAATPAYPQQPYQDQHQAQYAGGHQDAYTSQNYSAPPKIGYGSAPAAQGQNSYGHSYAQPQGQQYYGGTYSNPVADDGEQVHAFAGNVKREPGYGPVKGHASNHRAQPYNYPRHGQ